MRLIFSASVPSIPQRLLTSFSFIVFPDWFSASKVVGFAAPNGDALFGSNLRCAGGVVMELQGAAARCGEVARCAMRQIAVEDQTAARRKRHSDAIILQPFHLDITNLQVADLK